MRNLRWNSLKVCSEGLLERSKRAVNAHLLLQPGKGTIGGAKCENLLVEGAQSNRIVQPSVQIDLGSVCMDS